jgi:hypothetical protein
MLPKAAIKKCLEDFLTITIGENIKPSDKDLNN